METLANTKDNEARIKALKTIENTVGKLFWVGNTIHDDLDKCLTVLNLNSTNGGWYKPVAVRINGLTGIYMVNKNGSLFCEARIIKQDAKKYLIEYLSSEGWIKFEDLYYQFINAD